VRVGPLLPARLTAPQPAERDQVEERVQASSAAWSRNGPVCSGVQTMTEALRIPRSAVVAGHGGASHHEGPEVFKAGAWASEVRGR
jgi:hypothetical protein